MSSSLRWSVDDAAEPFFGNFGFDGFGGQLEAFEYVSEDLIEAIEIALVFHERGAREIIEILDAVAGDAGADGFEQRQVLFQRDRDFGGAELGEEGFEHARECSALIEGATRAKARLSQNKEGECNWLAWTDPGLRRDDDRSKEQARKKEAAR